MPPAIATTQQLRTESGTSFRLGPRLGREGGEGSVYRIEGEPGIVAKIYHGPVPNEKVAKLKYLADRVTPGLRRCAAWPLSAVFEGNRARGFLMRAVSGKEVHHVYGSRDRVLDFPGRHWDFLVNTARNCAAAFDEVHAIGAVIGDINEGNFLVQTTGSVTLIDCDSFQISNGSVSWTCDVGVPWWTPPELQGRGFRGLVRTPNHDLFGLALLIFKLMFMGQHPYAGFPVTETEEAIRKGLYAFSRSAQSYGVRPPHYTFPVAALPEEYSSMFERAFRADAPRPSAKEWVHALDRLMRTIVQCRSDKSHKFPSALGRCPWCGIASQGGPLFFVDADVVAVGVLGDNIGAIWAAILHIQRLQLTLNEQQRPNETLTPTPLPPNAKSLRVTFVWGLVLYLMAVIILFAGSIFLALICAVFATGMVCDGPGTQEFVEEKKRRKSVSAQIEANITTLRSQLAELTTKYNSDFDRISAELRQVYQRLSGLDREKLSETQQLEKNKFEHQLNEYLRGQLISRARIPGIGNTRKQRLLSYGVGSALDVRRDLQIPGFGPTYMAYLLYWRGSCEARFKFDPTRGVPPVEIQRVNLKFAALRNDLTSKLKLGPTTLTNLSAGTQGRFLQLRGQLEIGVRRLAQAHADLAACK
jgi:DNA-binding helix-hairpin-helix protein with protein kinase domain